MFTQWKENKKRKALVVKSILSARLTAFNNKVQKHVCHIQIILTFPTHSSVTAENRTHVHRTILIQNGLRNNLLRLLPEVVKQHLCMIFSDIRSGN